MLVPVLVVSPAMSRIRSNANLENSQPLPDDMLHKLYGVMKYGASVAAGGQIELHRRLWRAYPFGARGTNLRTFNWLDGGGRGTLVDVAEDDYPVGRTGWPRSQPRSGQGRPPSQLQ